MGNVHWKDPKVKKCKVTLVGKPGTRHYECGGDVVNWSSFDAREAQTYLNRRVREDARK